MGHFLECIPSSQGHSLAAAPLWGPGARGAGGRVVDWSRRTPNQSELLCKKLEMEQKEKLLSPTSKLWNYQRYCSEGLTEWQRKQVWRETKQKQKHSEDRKVVPQVEYWWLLSVCFQVFPEALQNFHSWVSWEDPTWWWQRPSHLFTSN